MSALSPFTRRGFLTAAAAASAAPALIGASSASAATAAAAPSITVRASSLGHNLTDDTAILQAALDSGANTVVIDKVPGGWITGPLHLDDTSNINPAGLRVVIEPGVMVRALSGAYNATRIIDRTMLSISNNPHPVTISGYGATLEMNKPEYIAAGITSNTLVMGLSIYGGTDVTVEGLTVRDTGGDGLYVSLGSSAYSHNITLRDVVCLDCARNGLSVISADGLTIEGCAFLQTNGTAPQSGVDFEPNANAPGRERLANVVMRDCVIDGNLSAGMHVSTHALTGGTTPMSILVERISIGGQVGGSPSLSVSRPPDDVTGSVEFRDMLLDISPGSAAFMVDAKPATSGPTLTLTNVSMWDWGNSFQVYEPITIRAGANVDYGGVTFDDCVLITDQPAPFLRAYDQDTATRSSALTGVHGTITVADPYGVHTDYGARPQDVDLTVRTEPVGAASQVSVRSSTRSVAGGETVDLVFTRRGGDLSTPLAVAYATSGTARERYDYGGLGKVAVIPPGAQGTTVRVQTYARRQDSDPRQRSLIVDLSPGFRYVCAPTPPAVVVISS